MGYVGKIVDPPVDFLANDVYGRLHNMVHSLCIMEQGLKIKRTKFPFYNFQALLSLAFYSR